jgi:anti-sigma factor RsiW
MTRDVEDDDLQAFVDRQLDPERFEAVIAHLATHPQDRRRVDLDLRQRQAIVRHADAQAGIDDDPLTLRLQEELAARLARRRRPWPWRQAGLAASLVLAGWFGNVIYQSHLAWKLPAVVGGAAQAHQIFADDPRRPVELPASRSAELRRWFSDHLGEPVEIPDLRPIGLRFVGGRLLATEQGPLAQMLYEDQRQRRLSVYLSTEKNDVEPEVRVVQIDGFTAGYWKDDSLVYTVVAETPTEQLLAVASEIGGKEPAGRP